MVLKMLAFSSLNHLTRLVAWEAGKIVLYNVAVKATNHASFLIVIVIPRYLNFDKFLNDFYSVLLYVILNYLILDFLKVMYPLTIVSPSTK
jgi:hypothetical protein